MMTFRSLKNEIWKDFPDFEGYQVSNMGRVRSFRHYGAKLVKTPHLLRPIIGDSGIFRICLTVNGYKKHFQISHLVMELFDEPAPFTHMVVGYRDGNKANLKHSNLYWTYRPHQKLTELEVKTIREMYLTSRPPYGMVASQYGVSLKTIKNIVYGYGWNNVKVGVSDTNATT